MHTRFHSLNRRRNTDLPFKCLALGCNFIGARVNDFKSHLRRFHPNGFREIHNEDNEELHNDPENYDEEMDGFDFQNERVDVEGQNIGNIRNHFLKQFCLKYYANPICSMKFVEELVKDVEDIIDNIEHNLRDVLNDFPEARERTCQYLDHLKAEAKQFGNIDRVVKYFKEEDIYEDPENIVIRRGPLDEEIMGTLFPIKKIIKNFLELPYVFQRIVENQNQLLQDHDPNILSNVVDGSIWRQVIERYPNDTIIPLTLYQDDMNPDNALGPHIKDTNLSIFYMSFPTLPSYCSSQKAIKPVMISKAEDVRLSCNPSMLRILEEFRSLEEGLDIMADGINHKTRFFLILVLGDNLALNTILGYVRSFNTDGFCRVCIMTKDESKEATREIENLIRNAENYFANQFGVKELCVLNDLEFYKAYINFFADLMHDLFLGAFKRAINKILIYLLNIGITIAEINEALQMFDWGKKEKENRPPKYSRSSIIDETINIYARETWTFVSYILFFLRNFLNPENEIYQFAVTMVDILDYVTQTSVSQESLTHLNNLIHTFNDFYRQNFGDLIPKMHYMTHYARLYKLYGPLKYLWSFAYERKHQTVKHYAYACKSRKNVAQSIATKLCIEEAVMIENKTNIFEKITDIGKIMNSDYFYLVENHNNFKSIKSLTYKHVEYCINDYILEQNFNFANKIIEIHINDEELVILIVQEIEIEFIPHLRSYQIKNDTEHFRSAPIETFGFQPTNSHIYFNEMFIRNKFL